ncbi:hypothetical protein [Occallatibacter savannae]|uniref:hypothetical protein n=1 Tax=Occallatibacter savannae TaxID=1002691 RepID=UPI0013A5AAAE|nr:hypothetical protein [Occallatibacter savannae]
MPSDPYRNFAEILEGTLSLLDYYERRMPDPPASLAEAKAAMQRAAADLRARIAPELPD